ncbi:hypothetical protein ACS0TY_022999 [Phlomoides rotata]
MECPLFSPSIFSSKSKPVSSRTIFFPQIESHPDFIQRGTTKEIQILFSQTDCFLILWRQVLIALAL